MAARVLPACALLLAACGAPEGDITVARRAATATPAYVQGAYTDPQSPQSTVQVAYPSAQLAGDLNVVVVGWNDATAQVTSVSDSKGNSYALAVGPTVLPGTLSQSIYYAKAITSAVAGANTVTVTFNVPAQYVDLRIAEYSGVDTTAPLDVTAVGTGNSATAATANATTTGATDLLVAGTMVTTWNSGAGAGYTLRFITMPDSDLLEDRVVTTPGVYAATAPLGSAGGWVIQMAAFRAAVTGGDSEVPTAPTTLGATAPAGGGQINLTWTASTDNVGVTGYRIERCQGVGCSTFAQIGTTAATTFGDTGLAISTSYSYRVRANDAAGNLSGYSNVAGATTPGDTVAPGAPAALAANPASTTQINLSWGAATDNVGVTSYLIERCEGAGCSSFVQVGTTAATTFSSTGLTAGTMYGYRVRASDGAGNLGAYSNVASAATPAPDATVPSAPGTLTATTASGTQINLSWGVATDNVGVTAYLVERCAGAACATFAQITSQAATTLSDTGLAAGTSYSYRVRASDAAGNLGAYSNTASATTSSSVAPPAHVQSRATDPQSSPTTVQLAYPGAQAAGNLNVVIVGWNNATSTVSSVTDSKGNAYALAVGPTTGSGMTQSIYYAKNIAAAAAGANTVTVTFNAATAFPDIRIAEYSGVDAANPVDVTAVGTGTGTTASTVAVTTTNASDLLVAGNMVTTYTNAAGAGFTLRQRTPTDGDILEDRVVTSTGSYTATATLTSGGWIMQMVAFRAAGGAAPPADTQAPTAPGTLAATPVSSTQINLSWVASTDNVGVTSYLVERCQGAGCATFAQIGTTAGTTFSSTGLALGTPYGYRVRATDAAGNLSTYSNVAAASTAGDTQAPTAPATLAAATASSSQINLTWAASSDNVGVASYRVERCQGVGCATFAQIATVTSPSFSDTGLALSTAYGYRVRAADAAGNLSSYSNVATATTSGDAQAPTAPESLVAQATSGNTINLAWTASTDNVGVTGYRVERCQGQGCVTFTQIGTSVTPAFSDPGLGWGVDYSYRVRAVDAAGNLSAYSNNGTTQTPFDTQAPTTPTSLTATVISNTQINVAWTASTDNVGVTSYLVERCQGAGCTTFAQIGTTAAVTFPSTGLTAGTSYAFRVRPTDAAGNLGAYSNVASATTTAPDTAAPSAPGALTAVTASASQINLSWGVSTDDVGVTSYLIERCQGAGCATFAQVTSQAATTLSDAGLAVGTSYSYRVRATDAAGNLGAYSNVASATTTATVANPAFVQVNYADPQTPQTQVQVPFPAAQTAGNLNVIAVGWNDMTAQVASVTDSKGNVYTRAVGPTAGQGMTQSMYYAKNIVAAAGGANTVTVTFNVPAAYPDVRIAEYANIDQTNPVDVVNGASGNGTLASTSVTTTFPVTMLVAADMVTTTTTGPGAGYITRVITSPDSDILEDWLVKTAKTWNATAGLTSGGWVIQVVAFKGLSGGGDTEVPSAPGALTASAVSMSQIDLSWGAATDNVGVTSYLVESCQGVGCTTFAQVGTVGGTAFSSTGLVPGASYSFRVRAADAAGNRGAYSAVATAATPTDAQAPTAPASLVATAAGNNQINLSWAAASDNVAVTSYLVERCQGAGCTSFAQVGTSTSLAFSNTGLAQGVTYGYRVRATDAAGNLGAYSPTATATTTADLQAPSAPAALAASAIGTSINLSWTASTDNVGVTSYLIERCLGAGCGSFGQIGTIAAPAVSFSDGGLATATTYGYRVRAVDAAGNLGVYSNVASATTASSVAAPAYVQGNSADPQGSFTTTQVKFNGAQAAGNLNVIAVGWNNTTSTVVSVVDSKGNPYALAVGPTSYPGVLSQSIYYAKNIVAAAAGSNTVTVTFSASTAYPDIRIAEYSGINGANPVDVTAVGTGTSTAAATASVTTTNASDLLVAANMVATYTTSAGVGFTLRIRSATDGDILEDRLVSTIGSYAGTSTLSSSGGWVMQMVAFRSAGSVAPPSDSTPPVVSITAPAAGATLSGTTVVSVSATDASPIGSVQLLVDGAPYGLPDTASPYQFSIDTAALANGAHTLGATATDAAANTGAATPVSVTFSNQAGQSGAWSALMSLPIVSVHAELLPNGTVLMSDAQNSFGSDARVWDPATNATTIKTAPSNIFCGAAEQMKDGRILFVGGHQGAHYGITDTNIYNPATASWSSAAQMAYPRWYPTVMMLADGRYMVVGGETNCNFCNVTQAEVYDTATNHWSPIGSPFDFPYYPHTFVLPNGRVFISSTTREPIASRVFDVATASWTAAGGAAVDGGSAIMYLPGKVLKTGTSVDPDQAVRTATAAAYVIDMTQTSPAPTWRQVASMGFARTYHSLTSLPDGTVLATGGGPTTAATDTANGVLRAELWSPSTETWTLLPPMAAARLYHSEALLLPDGRVAVMGGGRFDDVTLPTDQFSAQIFSPPYLFKGARPTITSAPSTISYGQVFSVQTPDAARIASVSLVRFGATTHSFNAGQRFVPLTFTAGSGTLTVTAPANSSLAPGGNYMLFLVDSSGVPSVAAIVHF
jgi:fibronectin type 3 domain-containing protein